MIHKLSQEIADALSAGENAALEVVDPSNNRIYFVVDEETHRRAMEALRRQQDREAIAAGIAQMHAGDVLPLEEARRQTRQELLSRTREK